MICIYGNGVTTPTNAYKCINISYIVNIIFFLHVSVTVVAILKEVYYKGWIYLATADVCAPLHEFKILSLKTTWFTHEGGIMRV